MRFYSALLIDFPDLGPQIEHYDFMGVIFWISLAALGISIYTALKLRAAINDTVEGELGEKAE